MSTSSPRWLNALLGAALLVAGTSHTSFGQTAPAAGANPPASDPTSLAPAQASVVGGQTPAEMNAAASSKDVLAFFLLDEDTGEGCVAKLKQAVERFNQGQADSALEALEDAVKLEPALPPARLLFGTMFLRGNNAQTWRQQLELVAKEHSQTPELYVQFGDLARAEGRLNDALLNYENAIKLGSRAGWPEKRAQRFMRTCYGNITQVEAQRQSWERALAAVNLWLRADAEDPAAHVQHARVLFFQGKPAEAAKELQLAVDLVTKNKLETKIDRPEVQMGWLYTQDNKLSEAEKAMRSAVDKYPEDADVHMSVASWMLIYGNANDAKQLAEQALKLNADSDELKRLLGVIALAAGDYTRAEEIFREQHQRAPGDMLASNYLALALIESDDNTKRQQAAQLAEINFRVNQQSSVAAATLGWIALRLNQPQQAGQLLDAALRSNQVTPDMLFYAAKLLNQTGNLNQAKAALEQAVTAQGVVFINRREAETWFKNLTGGPLPSTAAPSTSAGR